MKNKKRYLRIKTVAYVEMKEKETPEEAEKRFLCSLTEGTDIVKLESSYDDGE